MKKVLIISYNFPPKSGISSRRWAKLAKEFQRNNIDCHVITRDGGEEKGVNWTRDLSTLDPSKIHRLKNQFPRFIEKPTTSFLNRVIKYLMIKLLKNTFFPLDAAQFFYKNLIPKAKEIINSGVNNIIVSGPPHSLFFHAAVLKNEHPEINLILDYRDAWNDELNYEYGTSLKSYSTKMKSLQMELMAINSSDHVLFVTDDMRKRMLNIYKQFSDKFHTCHNFYDTDDYSKGTLDNKIMNDVVYLGTLGSSRRKALELIAVALKELEAEGERVDYKFHFYTNETINLFARSPHYSIIKKYFRFYPMVSSDKLTTILPKYSVCLSINDPNYAHAFGTKIFDYFALKKKVFHISNGGELYGILEDGNHLVAPYDQTKVKKILKSMNSSESFNNYHDNFSQFDLKNQAKKIIKILKV